MERGSSRSKADRREIHSVCMPPVPTIILNTTAVDKGDQSVLSHSRSAGDLDMVIADMDDCKTTCNQDGQSRYSTSGVDGVADSRNAIGLYCSPRMPRRSLNSSDLIVFQKQPNSFLDSGNTCNASNTLDPGSRVGSTISLSSEYTSRSVGLISNDSSSECSHLYQPGLMDGSFQKHSVLKRFYSSPEKDDDLLQHESQVRRNSRSLGNVQGEAENLVCFDFGSDSTDDNLQPMETVHCDTGDRLSKKVVEENRVASNENNLVTAITGGTSLREGRIRKWLNELSDPVIDEPTNS